MGQSSEVSETDQEEESRGSFLLWRKTNNRDYYAVTESDYRQIHSITVEPQIATL